MPSDPSAPRRRAADLFFGVFGAMTFIATLAVCAVAAVAMLPFAALARGRRERFTLPIGMATAWVIARCILLTRVRVEGASDLSPGQGALIVSNHRSWLDPLLLMAWTRSNGLAKHDIRRLPVIGYIAWLSGAVFIDRSDPASRAAGRADVLRQIRRGVRIQLFPEGTRSRDGQLKERVHLALIEDCAAAGIPVVPCAVYNTERSLPTGRIQAVPLQRVSLHIGAAMRCADGEDPAQFALRVWDAVARQVQQMSSAGGSVRPNG